MTAPAALIYVVDDDGDLGLALCRLLRRNGYSAEPFDNPALLLQAFAAEPAHCVVSDIMMEPINGLDFAQVLRGRDPTVAMVFMTAWPTTADAVDSVRRFGGFDYLEKPIDEGRLFAAIAEAVRWSMDHRAIEARLARLTARERDVFNLLVRGLSSKMIAADLNLSPKTVEDHRAAIMAKTGSNGLAQLIAMSSRDR